MIKRNTIAIIVLLLFVTNVAKATIVGIRVLTTTVVKTFIFAPLGGTYSFYGDGVLITSCDSTNIFQLKMFGDSVQLKTFKKSIGTYQKIKIVSENNLSAFKVKSVSPIGKMHTFNDNLEISITRDKSQLLLLNRVELEDYIAGVVQSEAGKGIDLEYYKLQSILCRTYLLANLTRHYDEGFGVCSDVHCQAYLNRSTEGIIVKAVQDTKGLVVVDNNLNLITAAFHSNCGGQTCNSQDVWSRPVSYLKAIKDTFCLHKSQAHWKRTISVEDWESYLSINKKYGASNSVQKSTFNNFSQADGREIYYITDQARIPLKKIRSDFKLKSTYFSIRQEGENLIFDGKGYGHGVGLCQQGAMHMSWLEKSYKEILHFYYKDVNLVDLSALNYFHKK